MSAFNFSAHERMLMSGERKMILFNLYDQILLEAYFGHLIWNFDTFDHPSGYFRPNLYHFYRFLTLLITLRAISDLIYTISIDFYTFDHPSGYFRTKLGLLITRRVVKNVKNR
jgi:hypothetical protein